MRSAVDAACAKNMKNEWDVEAAISTYNVDGWGTGYFTVNAAGNAEVRPLKEKGGAIDILDVVNEARDRGLGFPLVIRFQDLLRHRVESVNCAFQRAIERVRLQEPLSRRVPDQGEPAPGSDRRDRRGRAAISLRPRSRQQTRAGCGARHAQGPGEPDHLQRLQGPRVHSDRVAGPQARQIGHHRGRENSRSWSRPSARPKKWASSRTSASGFAFHSKGSGKWSPSGGENAKFGLDTDESRGRERNVEGGRPRRIASSSFISMSARRSRTFPRSNGRCAKRRVITRSSPSWAMSSVISTSAAGSAWITTARAATSTARPITRSRNTRTTSSGTSWTSAIPKGSRIRQS